MARLILYGKVLKSRGPSSSFGREGDNLLHESDDAEFGSSHAHKQQASDASGSSPPLPKCMQQIGTAMAELWAQSLEQNTVTLQEE